jgi:hypothetical protein
MIRAQTDLSLEEDRTLCTTHIQAVEDLGLCLHKSEAPLLAHSIRIEDALARF